MTLTVDFDIGVFSKEGDKLAILGKDKDGNIWKIRLSPKSQKQLNRYLKNEN